MTALATVIDRYTDDDVETLTFSWSFRDREEARLAMCRWCKTHGIDPGDVCADGWIQRRVNDRQVAYLGLVRDDKHRPVVEAGGLVHQGIIVQLEARPMPFPEEVP